MMVRLKSDVGDLNRSMAALQESRQKLEHLNLVLNTIRKVNELVTREKDRGRLIQKACEILIKNRGYHNAWIILLDASGGLLVWAQAGLDQDFAPLLDQLKNGKLTHCGNIALKQQDVVVRKDPVSECKDCPLATKYAGRGGMTVKVAHAGNVYGLLSVSMAKDLTVDREEQALFKEVAHDIAFGLHGIELESEQKKMSAALRESEETFRKISASANDGIIMMNNAGNISFWNQAAERIFGYSDQEALGKALHVFLAPKRYLAAYKKGFDQFKTSGRGDVIGNTMELSAIRKNGEEFPMELSVSTLSLKGKWHAAGILRDISHRKLAEKKLIDAKEAAEAATRAKSEFLANMSHEIRTPMNGVIAAADLALGETLSPKAKRYLNTIHDSAYSLLGVINDILDFSKIEAGKFNLEMRVFHVDEVLEQVADMFNQQAANKGIELIVDIDTEIPGTLIGDPLRLQQILKNLVDNAVKFTERAGAILVVVKKLTVSSKEVSLSFSVKDFGIGISPEYVARLFDPFTQEDTSSTRKYQGTGLGLVICKKLVGLMNGRIWAESVLGKGSTFTFTAGFKCNPATHNRVFTLPSDIQRLRVLVVDDCDENKLAVKKMLRSFGFQVEVASSGYDALNKLKKHQANEVPFDLVMMDWLMSGMDGIETSRRVRTDLITPPPIILMTAFGKETEKMDAQEAGISGFLNKPIFPSTLFNAILDTFGKQHPKRSNEKGSITTRASIYKKHLNGCRILVVEDNPINQEIAVAVLEDAGMFVQIAGNGKEAVKAVQRAGFDAVLMDIQMPEMDGYAATREIRNLNSDVKNIPIIAMTAHAMKGDEEKCLASGMDGYVPKPIIQDRLLGTLWRFVRAGKGQNRNTEKLQSIENEPEKDLGPLPNVIPGIHIQGALEALKIGPDDFLRVLTKFLGNNRDTIAKIRKAYGREDLEKFEFLAHTLKGSAGNIGAKALYEAAQTLESEINESPPATSTNDRIAYVESKLNEVMHSIETLANRNKRDVSEKPPAPMDMEKAIHRLHQLDLSLEMANPVTIQEKMDNLGGYLSEALIGKLRCEINNYDYDHAKSSLKEIEQQLTGESAHAR
ncbi:MAG: response regulator [Deltaproteobacteria bacterium]|nr:response regulator [Deltaproteobacteria bacterium]